LRGFTTGVKKRMDRKIKNIERKGRAQAWNAEGSALR